MNAITLAWMEPPRETMPRGYPAGDSLRCQWDVAQQHTSMDGEEIHTLQHSILSAGQNTTTMEPQTPSHLRLMASAWQPST